MRKIVIITVLSLIIISFLGVFGYFVVKGLLELGYPALVVAGALLIIIGGLVATNRAEKIAEMNNQLTIQAWAMQNTVHEGTILPVYEPSDPGDHPDYEIGRPLYKDPRLTSNRDWADRHLAAEPTTWHVRKQDDGLGYSILPLIKGAPQWDLAIQKNIENPIKAHYLADEATRRSITAA